ncbi:sodium:proton antiporter [Solemya pervernicosa gill symbiont]|uniref:Sodium:proton antiporter n=1 Tax=Solemya pervernicosa gill symbiont TaxID=642797 RepID=A0A1T2L338_9GAMM|nr:monovalent cation/H(+) antiporter subunit G [Solemya pervernicosa gill symbiont]OOZ39515.1 sodium:proton antiporter [Solemya pervernicosa gill symbiont]
MSAVIDLASWICLLGGGFLCITGGVGLLRFPDFFSRVHAVGVTETLAAPLLLLGVMLQMGFTLDAAKLLMVLVFVLATNPTASHAMAKAALHGGHKPQLADDQDAVPGTDEEKASS